MCSCRGDLQIQIRVASGNSNLSRILLTGLVLHLCRKNIYSLVYLYMGSVPESMNCVKNYLEDWLD